MTKNRDSPIPAYKLRAVKDLVKSFKEEPTILIASIRNLPGGQFQAIKQKLRNENMAKVKVLKKSLVVRAIEEFAKTEKSAEEIKNFVKEDCAILISETDPFELASFLLKNRTPAKAKIGQEVPEDIRVEAGPTDLVPGPVLSELGALGIPFQIKDGKIEVREAKVILKAGQKVTPAANAMMSKLNIMPFRVGYEPLAAFSSKDKKVYSELKIDSEGALNSLKDAYSRSLALAVKIVYPAREAIGFILAKAKINHDALGKLIKSDSQETK